MRISDWSSDVCSSDLCNGTVSVRQGTMMNAAPVPLGDGARMSFLYRDPKNYADPNGNSVVVRLDLGAKRILLAGDAEGGERELPSEPPQPNRNEAKRLACGAPEHRRRSGRERGVKGV